MRKFVALVLSIVLMVMLLPVNTLAASGELSSWLKLPYVYAPGYTAKPSVSVLGDGVTSGALVLGEQTENVPYNDGSTADLLMDGYYATFSESKHIAVCGIGESGDARVMMNAKASASNNTGKMLKFSEVDSGIEINFAGTETVSALHLWAWPSNAIGDYEVQAETDGVWETVQTGNLEDDRNATVQNDCSTFYQLQFDRNYSVSALRFVIKTFGSNASANGVHLVEAVPRPTNEINLTSVNPMRSLNQALTSNTETSYPIYFDTYVVAGYGWNTADVETGKNGLTVNCRRAGIWNNSNLFGADKNGSKTDGYPVNYPAYDTRVINPANKSTTPKNGYYAVASLGGTRKINRLTFLTSNINALNGVELFCTDDTTAWDSLATKGVYKDHELDSKWTKILSVTGTFANNTAYTYDIANAPTAKYWAVRYMCNSHTVINNTAMYSLRENELSPYAALIGEALNNLYDGAVATDSLDLPSVVTDASGNETQLSWSCDSALVDLATGAITPPQNDTVITVTAIASIGGQNYKLSRKVSVLGQDTRTKAVLKEVTYDSVNVFSEMTGDVEANNGVVTLTNGATASFDIQPGYGFNFSGKTILELTLDNLSNGGSIEFYDGSLKLMGLNVDNGNIIAEYKNCEYEHSFTNDVKIEFSGNSFNLYFKEGDQYVLRVYGGKLLTDGSADTMKLVASSGKTLAMDYTKLTVVSEELFNQINDQFDLKKINPSGGSNLKENLNLISSIGDITFNYNSSDSALVDPVTGTVNVGQTGPVTIDVNAVSPSGVFSKSFSAVISGLPNGAASSVATANGAALQGFEIGNVNDDNLDTEFRLSQAQGWKLTLDLKESKPMNRICLYESDGVGEINGFIISLSSDGSQYTDVYTGTGIVSGELLEIPTQFARYIRINVTSVTQDTTGLKEVYVYLKQTDREKLEYDLNEITDGLEIKNGVSVPKTGVFGSDVTIFSDNSLITAVSEGNKWKITAGTPERETVVKVTLNLRNGTETMQKEYNVILLADTNIRDNQPDFGITEGNSPGTGGGSGGSGGGFGGGFGGSGGGSSSSVYMPSVETGVQDSAYSAFEQELAGHWGKTEIMTLVRRGIVSGDGTGLKLTQTVTRAEFLKMLLEVCKFEKTPYAGEFADITDSVWYADYAQTAKNYGIMSGDGTNFRGNDPITRQEMAVTLVNCVKLLNANITETEDMSFNDNDDIAAWAKDSVKIAAGLNLLKGYEDGTFLPKNSLLREEAMVVAYRVLTSFMQ